MAGLLSRFTTFLPNTTILSNDHNQEFNRIVQLLNGTTTNLKIVLKTSDTGDPPLELDQLSTGPILKGFQGGIEKFRFRNDGSLRTPGIYDTNDNEQLLFTLTASAVNEFTVKNAATGNPPELQTTGGDGNISLKLVPKGTGVVKIQSGAPVANEDAANKLYVDGRTVGWSGTAFIVDPSTAALNSEDYPSVVVPAVATTFKITHIRVEYRAGSHTAGGSVTFKVTQRGSVNQDLGTISLDNTNNAPFTLYSNDIADVTLAAGDRMVFTISARSGTVSERNVSVFIEGVRNVS